MSIHAPTQNKVGNVPLHAASGKGHVNVMTVLIQRGADVDYLNKVHVEYVVLYSLVPRPFFPIIEREGEGGKNGLVFIAQVVVCVR